LHVANVDQGDDRFESDLRRSDPHKPSRVQSLQTALRRSIYSSEPKSHDPSSYFRVLLSSNPDRRRRVNFIFTLPQAGVIGTRCDVAKADVVRYRAKEGNTCTDQYWHACDHQSVDTSRREESLNGDAPVYIGMFEPAGLELLYDFGRFPRHLLDHAALDR